VVLRGYEQESCFILFIWAFAMMAYKTRSTLHERTLHQQSLINVGAGVNILPEDARSYTRPLQALDEREQRALLPRALIAALNRFASTENVQDVAEAVKTVCENEYERLESELSMIRYIAWAIPSIGFIGTVRGIGDALGQVYEAVEGNIAGVTASLGVAFNSTFIALLISILLMFLLHQLQLIQERLVLDTQHYCDQQLLRHLRSRHNT
jgi:biopolymer transport protein ExbB/TolQ